MRLLFCLAQACLALRGVPRGVPRGPLRGPLRGAGLERRPVGAGRRRVSAAPGGGGAVVPGRVEGLLRRVDDAQVRVLGATSGWSFTAQLGAVLALYAVHTLCLSRGCVLLPFQLVPNGFGLWQSVGYDSLAGGVFLALRWLRLRARRRESGTSSAVQRSAPWVAPRRPSAARFAVTVAALAFAYQWSGYAALVCEDLMYSLSLRGYYVSTAMRRAFQVLSGHAAWVAAGSAVLTVAVDDFWGRKRRKQRREGGPPQADAPRWFAWSLKGDWLWWVAGGYAVSSLAFNVADGLNHFLVPAVLFEDDTLVTQMINPENNDVLALVAGGLAPCLTAPWWEETLYRGFLLPALHAFAPRHVALPLSAVLFAAHHLTLTAALPLAVLGAVWAQLYVASGNLVVPIAIHALWNTRVFLGALLGL